MTLLTVQILFLLRLVPAHLSSPRQRAVKWLHVFVFYVIDSSGKVIVDDKGIKDCWKEYMEKLMNEENEWDHKISAEVKEGPADCIRMAEVRAVLKKMKRHKAP